MASDLRARRFFLFLTIGASVLLAAVFYPLAGALFVAAVLAGVLIPVQRRLTKLLQHHDNVSAGVLVFFVVVILVGPIAALSAFVVKEVAEGVKFLQQTIASEGVTGLIERLPDSLEHFAKGAIERFSADSGAAEDLIQNRIEAQGAKAAAAVGAILSATSSFLFHAAMMLIALFFLLVDGERLVSWLDRVSPLKPGQTRELLAEFRKVSYSVVVSSLITAAVQAIAALVGYLIAGIGHPVFFAALTFIVAFIPAVGASGVCLVAALILFVTGHPYMAIFLAIWGLLVVGLVDNLIKPLLMRGGMQMHGAVVFFSLIGGLAVFGAIGLLVGPLAVAFFVALLRMYDRDFASDAAKVHAKAHEAR